MAPITITVRSRLSEFEGLNITDAIIDSEVDLPWESFFSSINEGRADAWDSQLHAIRALKGRGATRQQFIAFGFDTIRETAELLQRNVLNVKIVRIVPGMQRGFQRSTPAVRSGGRRQRGRGGLNNVVARPDRSRAQEANGVPEAVNGGAVPTVRRGSRQTARRATPFGRRGGARMPRVSPPVLENMNNDNNAPPVVPVVENMDNAPRAPSPLAGPSWAMRGQGRVQGEVPISNQGREGSPSSVVSRGGSIRSMAVAPPTPANDRGSPSPDPPPAVGYPMGNGGGGRRFPEDSWRGPAIIGNPGDGGGGGGGPRQYDAESMYSQDDPDDPENNPNPMDFQENLTTKEIFLRLARRVPTADFDEFLRELTTLKQNPDNHWRWTRRTPSIAGFLDWVLRTN